MLKWFDFRVEKLLATELAQGLFKHIPVELMRDKRTALSVNKITRLLETTYKTVNKHQLEKPMGVIHRAVFLNTIKWELKQHGYPDDFVSLVVEGLVIEIANSRQA